jgi:membrane protease YdiL (CAAX protease family)
MRVLGGMALVNQTGENNMIFGKRTGMGPALRVLRHFAEREQLHKIEFQSGERALLMIAGLPVPSVELVRLALGGLVPWQTVWEYNPMRAGGYSDYMHKLKAMFSPAANRSDESVHHIRDALLQCRSIQEARTLLLERERRADSATAEVDFRKYEPRSSVNNDDWKLGSDLTPNPSPPERAKISAVPNRYRISNDDHGRFLTCVEAPMVMVRAEPGIAISAKRARNYQAGAIFLDGAAQGEPFVDVKKDLYNLDHPEGCIRSLAICEQAMVLIRKGLDLRKRDWVVLANDADLDTIFAVWVLLNYLRLNADAEVRAKVMPLLRFEGAIDAHGAESQDLCALPSDLLRSISYMEQKLRQQEDVLKHYGRWAETDLLEYIADRLRAVDQLLYSPDEFDGLCQIDELARAEMAGGSVAVVCRSSDAPMDEVERRLQKIYGQRLGILIFEVSNSTCNVRQLDGSLPATLERAYERLNLLDPVVTGASENRWGGSAESGSSPRKTGTGLAPAQIVEAIRDTFRAPTMSDLVSAIPRAAFLAAAALSPALALNFIGNLLRDKGYIAVETGLLSALVLSLTAGFLFWTKARRVPGLYGWRVPAGFGWVRVLPLAILGAAAGGVWAPGSLAWQTAADGLYPFSGIAVLLFPLGAELLFRGVLLGHLAAHLPIQKSGGVRQPSWPTLISSVLYAGASLLFFRAFAMGQIHVGQWLFVAGGAAAFGLASGAARERSESILASVLLHWVCAAALLLSSRLLF